MGFIAFLFIGLLAGWIAEKIMSRSHGLLTNLIVGVVGAYLGGFLLGLFGVETTGAGFWMSLVTAVIGAVVLLWITGKLFGRSRAA